MKSQHPLRALWTLVQLAPRWRLVMLLGAMVGVALTEGFGIVMLVPLLGALDTTRGAADIALGPIHLPLLTLESILLVVAALTLLRGALQYVQTLLSGQLQYQLVDDLRARCFGGLIFAEWRWLSERQSADHAALLMTNISRIGYGLGQAAALVSGSFAVLACLAAAFLLSWQIALLAIAGGVMALVAFRSQRRRALHLGEDLSAANRALIGQIQDGIAGIRQAKILGKEEANLSAFVAVLTRVRLQLMAYILHGSRNHLVLQTLGALAIAVMVYIAVVWLELGYAIILPMVLVFARLVPIFGALQQNYHHWLHAVSAYAETQQLLADTAKVAEPKLPGGWRPLPLTDRLELDNVSFTYASRAEASARGQNIILRAHTTTAIIGPSGAGKSTLADLIMGLIEPDSGTVTVDGLALQGDVRQRWRRSVAYVQQDAFLLSDSIRANLLWAQPDASDADMLGALENAAAAEFVARLPHGLDTLVGDGGARLSGGERQRIALARALLGSPSLLILDEATSALDPASEEAIRKAIARLHGNMTIIIIGHRLTMLEEADQIVELNAGQIAKLSLRQAAN
jgi:ATP-binding cassette, subfamily C, bacterial